MPRIKVKAAELIADIRAGMGKWDLMDKHRLSHEMLQQLLVQLVTKGLMTRDELRERGFL